MNKQERLWSSGFGNQYTDRNIIDWKDNLPIWKEVLNNFDPGSILELGCNRGHNLKALTFLGASSVGIDINEYALSVARKNGQNVRRGSILELPFATNSFNLIFTMGVLIHISPNDLPTVAKEVHRVSKHFILAIEYPAEIETVIQYHGHDDLLWKRDFSKVFLGIYPELQLIKYWQWGTEDKPFYDRLDGWLFGKEK